jgi:hypothetical protein
MLVSLRLDQHIGDFPFSVDGAPEMNHPPIDFQIDLVEMPSGVRLADAVCQRRDETGVGALDANRVPSALSSDHCLRSATTSRSSTRNSTPLAGHLTVLALASWSRPMVITQEIVRADEARLITLVSILSGRRRRPLHSLTMRRHPRNRRCFSERHSSEPLRQPASHCLSSQGR